MKGGGGGGWLGGGEAGLVLALPLSKGQKECFQSSPFGVRTRFCHRAERGRLTFPETHRF